ncbi:hypothetical protein EDD16DRAFT_1528830 [Pisolithus croceorrhizus]|nr:hypothetical protein EDD16DRAFT_1528830 [Pisolithus croceorrhizus]
MPSSAGRAFTHRRRGAGHRGPKHKRSRRKRKSKLFGQELRSTANHGNFGEVRSPNIGASRIDIHRRRRSWSAISCGDLVNPVLEDVQGTDHNVGGPPDAQSQWTRTLREPSQPFRVQQATEAERHIVYSR